MSKSQCPICYATSHDALMCAECQATLVADLASIVDLWSDLKVTLARQDRLGSGGNGGRKTEEPAPINLHALEVQQDAETCLVGWTRVLCEDFGLEPPSRDIRAICSWLTGHVGYIRRHEACADMWVEIGETARAIRRTVDAPPERLTPISVGVCPHCGERWTVRPEQLLEDIPAVVCPRDDGTKAKMHNLRTILDERLITETEACARSMDGRRIVKNQTFESWVNRGKLIERGKLDGKPAYRLGEVRFLIATRRRKGA